MRLLSVFLLFLHTIPAFSSANPNLSPGPKIKPHREVVSDSDSTLSVLIYRPKTMLVLGYSMNAYDLLE